MTGRKRSLGLSTAAQVAVFALVFQVLAGAFGCPAEFAQAHRTQVFSNAAGEGAEVVVCTAQGVKRLAATSAPVRREHQNEPFNAPHADCPLCLTHICCPSALAPPAEVTVFTPAAPHVRFAVETWRRPASVDVLSLRNRGPPTSPSV